MSNWHLTNRRFAVAHADETGIRIEGTPQWLHTFSTPEWTFQAVHDKRGSEAFDDIGVIPRYSGILVHDCNMPYFKDGYSFELALCGAHLKRLERRYTTILHDGEKMTKLYPIPVSRAYKKCT